MEYTTVDAAIVINCNVADTEKVVDRINDFVLSLDDVQDISFSEPELHES